MSDTENSYSNSNLLSDSGSDSSGSVASPQPNNRKDSSHLTRQEIDKIWAREFSQMRRSNHQGNMISYGPRRLCYHQDLLIGETNWVSWQRNIKTFLARQSLDALLNDNRRTKRPLLTDRLIDKWADRSFSIGCWLITGLSTQFYEIYVTEGRGLCFADDVWHFLKKKCQPPSAHGKGRIWGTFKTTLAADYNDVATFTTAYCNAYNGISEAACPFPYLAIMDYMHEVEKYDKTAADIVRKDLDALDGKLKPQDYTDEMFYDVIAKFQTLLKNAEYLE